MMVRISLFVVLASLLLCALPPQRTRSRVHYRAVSRRALSAVEKSRFEDVHGLQIAVRLEFSNDSDVPVRYLANAGSVVPAGYQLFRERGATSWQSTSPGRGREGPPGTEFTGVGYSWLELPPHASVEFEAHDWASHTQEHAFSTFVREGNEMYEVISDPYVPLPE